MDNNLKCLILSYITDSTDIVRLLLNNTKAIAQRCITTITNLLQDHNEINIILNLTNLAYIDDVYITELSEVIKLAQLPQLQSINVNFTDLIWDTDMIAAIFCETYLSTKVNGSYRTLNDKKFAFIGTDQVLILNGIVNSHFPIHYLVDTLIKNNNLLGFTLDPELYTLNFMLNVKTLSRFAMPAAGDGQYPQEVIQMAIDLLNTNRITLVTESKLWAPDVTGNTRVLIDAKPNNVLQIIDFSIDINSIDMIINKFKNVKQINLYLNRNSFINQIIISIVHSFLTKYPNLVIVLRLDKDPDLDFTLLYQNINNNRVKFE